MPISSRPPAAPGAVDAIPQIAKIAALDHPLPSGMRDTLPVEAHGLAELTRHVMATFALYGYERVSLPVFEYAEVLERGLGQLGPREVLRFVEPETGEVVALRSDVTPQIARLVATQMADEPQPARLAYRGSVLRRRHERARSNQQVAQAGIELVGAAGAEGDLEVVAVATAAVRACGLDEFVLDLGHAEIAWSLLAATPRSAWPRLVDALSVKDADALRAHGRAAGVGEVELETLCRLLDLHGGEEVWEPARAAVAGTVAEAPVRELEAFYRAVIDAGLAREVTVDFGETWSHAYYTGMIFQLLAPGPGEPIGAGGRYDRLLRRFRADRPSAGFALHLDNLAWAMRHRGIRPAAATKVLVVGKKEDGAAPILAALRSLGIACAVAPAGDTAAYARSWRFSHVLELSQTEHSLKFLADDARVGIAETMPDAVAAAVQRAVG